ncbi:MAG: hypothetical protein ACI81R_003316 [Bradymonadia bacterium]|jgi:hypothetical protein
MNATTMTALALFATSTLAPLAASAQDGCYKGECDGLMTDAIGSNYLSATIGRGYEAPPEVLRGVSGGEIDASYLGRTVDGPCRGVTTALPDHMLTLTERTDSLQLNVTSRGDTVLLVHGPDGWRCNDDADGQNPSLSGTWAPGTYRVWVASYDQRFYDYALLLDFERRRPPHRPERPPIAARPDTAATSALYESFVYDPAAELYPIGLDGLPGGNIDLEPLGSTRTGPCDGFVSEGPQHIMTLTDTAWIEWRVESATDTTLAIHGPRGWLCNDDSEGLNPGLGDRVTPGEYRIWVGSYRLGETGNYSLFVDQLERATIPEPIAIPLVVTGTFEDTDVRFDGETPEDIHRQCMGYVQVGGSFDWVDNVTLNGRSAANTFGYWSPAQLCVMAASSVSRPEARFVAEGTIEDVPFLLGAESVEALRDRCTWMLEGAFGDLWIDDIVVNGQSRHNDFGYWESADACMIVSTLATDLGPDTRTEQPRRPRSPRGGRL